MRTIEQDLVEIPTQSEIHFILMWVQRGRICGLWSSLGLWMVGTITADRCDCSAVLGGRTRRESTTNCSKKQMSTTYKGKFAFERVFKDVFRNWVEFFLRNVFRDLSTNSFVLVNYEDRRKPRWLQPWLSHIEPCSETQKSPSLRLTSTGMLTFKNRFVNARKYWSFKKLYQS